MKHIVKIGISLALIFFLIQRLDWKQVFDNLEHLRWWVIPVAVALQAAAFVLANSRWWLLLRTHNRGHRFSELLPQTFIGAFFNNVLPTSTGGDFFRIYYIYKQQHGAAISISPVITERIIGLATLIGLATVVLPFLDQSNKVISVLTRIVPFIFLGVIVAFSILASRITYRPVHNFFQRWRRNKLINAGLKIVEASHVYFGHIKLLILLVTISLFLQLMEVGVFYFLGMCVSASVEFDNYLVMVPMIMLAAAFPLSLGGLGVREAATVALFTAIGMSEANAAIVALFFIPVLLIASSPGLIFFIKMKNHREIYQKAAHDEVPSESLP